MTAARTWPSRRPPTAVRSIATDCGVHMKSAVPSGCHLELVHIEGSVRWPRRRVPLSRSPVGDDSQADTVTSRTNARQDGYSVPTLNHPLISVDGRSHEDRTGSAYTRRHECRSRPRGRRPSPKSPISSRVPAVGPLQLRSVLGSAQWGELGVTPEIFVGFVEQVSVDLGASPYVATRRARSLHA